MARPWLSAFLITPLLLAGAPGIQADVTIQALAASACDKMAVQVSFDYDRVRAEISGVKVSEQCAQGGVRQRWEANEVIPVAADGFFTIEGSQGIRIKGTLPNLGRNQADPAQPRLLGTMCQDGMADVVCGRGSASSVSLPLPGANPGTVPTAVAAGVSLLDAIQNGQVAALFLGTGASSGDAILLKVRKLGMTGGTSEYTLPAGVLLRSGVSGEQGMILAGIKGRTAGAGTYIVETKIQLADMQEREYLLEAYCADFAKGNPSPQSVMRVNGHDARAACVIAEGQRHSFSIQALQAAIWLVREKVPYDRMQSTFPVTQDIYDKAADLANSCGLIH